jgi:hypothetical protein
MKYLCLCYYDQAKFDALSEDDQEALGRACRPHDEALRNSGRLILVARSRRRSRRAPCDPGAANLR